jgi:hypothetical protein
MRPRLRPGALPLGGTLVPPKVFRAVLGIGGEISTKTILRIEPLYDRRIEAAASQWVDLGEAIALPHLHGRAEAVPAESGADAGMQFAIRHEPGGNVLKFGRMAFGHWHLFLFLALLVLTPLALLPDISELEICNFADPLTDPTFWARTNKRAINLRSVRRTGEEDDRQ